MKKSTGITSKTNGASKRSGFGNEQRRPTGLRCRFTQIICAILIACILTVSTPAAPLAVKVSLSELHQDVRFGLASNGFGTVLSSWTNSLLLFFAPKQQTNSISRIEILPGGDGGITVRQGEPVNFSAIAYSAEENPVGGLRFNWTVRDAGRNRSPRNLPNGTFNANIPGSFLITAETGGYRAQVNITVEENEPLTLLKRILEEKAGGNQDAVKKLAGETRFTSEAIDSKRDYKVKNGGEDASSERTSSQPSAGGAAASNTSSTIVMRPANDDGWGNDNWWMADDPGNNVGNPPGAAPDTGNGNFQFSAPVVALPGRGIDLSLSLNYNSRVWSKAGTQMIFDAERGFPAPGWSLGFGKMTFLGTSGGCMLIDADGTNHGFTGTVSNTANGSSSSTNFNGYTTDGSFIDYGCYVSTSNGVTSMSASAKLANGTQIYYNVNSANGKQAFPTQISDPQGNYITVYYQNNRGPNIQTVTDTMGRVVTFNYDSLNRLISVAAPKMDNAGTRTVVRLHYKQLTLSPGFAFGITTDTNNNYPYVVDSVYYPGTNTGYWFNDTDSYSSSKHTTVKE
jgi:YD repeat-containing protein